MHCFLLLHYQFPNKARVKYICRNLLKCSNTQLLEQNKPANLFSLFMVCYLFRCSQFFMVYDFGTSYVISLWYIFFFFAFFWFMKMLKTIITTEWHNHSICKLWDQHILQLSGYWHSSIYVSFKQAYLFCMAFRKHSLNVECLLRKGLFVHVTLHP